MTQRRLMVDGNCGSKRECFREKSRLVIKKSETPLRKSRSLENGEKLFARADGFRFRRGCSSGPGFFFLHQCGTLAQAFAEVGELGAADFATAFHFHLFH